MQPGPRLSSEVLPCRQPRAVYHTVCVPPDPRHAPAVGWPQPIVRPRKASIRAV